MCRRRPGSRTAGARWVSVLTIAAVVATGCRNPMGGRPSMVRWMQEEPSDIEITQRPTVRPGEPDARSADLATDRDTGDRNPHGGPSQPRRRPPRSPVTSQVDFASLIGGDAPADAEPAVSAKSAPKTAARPPVANGKAEPDDKPEPDDEPIPRSLQQFAEALVDAPPEVRRRAMQRLITTSAGRAKRTSQAGGLNDFLNDSLADMPPLPNEVPMIEAQPWALGKSPAGTRPAQAFPEQKAPPVQVAVAEPPVSKPSDPAGERSVDAIAVSPAAKEDAKTPIRQVSHSLHLSDSPAVADSPKSLEELIQSYERPVTGETEAARGRRFIIAQYLRTLTGQIKATSDDGPATPLTDAEADFLRHQLAGLSTLIDPAGHPVVSHRLSEALPSIRQATVALAAATDTLEVRSLQFCTEIEAYGQTKPFTDTRFKAGQAVIVYCEIDNFQVETLPAATAGGARRYETEMQGSYEIFDTSGNRVVSQGLPVDLQNTASPVRDYFIAYQMNLPNPLAAGRYTLRLTMEDLNGHKYGQSEVGFEIR